MQWSGILSEQDLVYHLDMSFDFLEKQLGQYHDQAEAWRDAHTEAMCCRDIEDAIRYGLFLIDAIQRQNSAWAEDIDRGLQVFSWEVAGQFANAYRSWHAQSETLLAAVRSFEARGLQVEGAGVLREKYREVSLLPFDMQRVRESIESLDRGEGTPLEQAIDELRRHHMHAKQVRLKDPFPAERATA
jgi:hypothetical protein